MTKEEVLSAIQENLTRQDTEEITTLLFSVVYQKRGENTERIAQIISGSLGDIFTIVYEIAKAIGLDNFRELSSEIIEQLPLELEEDGD